LIYKSFPGGFFGITAEEQRRGWVCHWKQTIFALHVSSLEPRASLRASGVGGGGIGGGFHLEEASRQLWRGADMRSAPVSLHQRRWKAHGPSRVHATEVSGFTMSKSDLHFIAAPAKTTAQNSACFYRRHEKLREKFPEEI
jgi:hypothetical protein